jgi:hypothetical protein
MLLVAVCVRVCVYTAMDREQQRRRLLSCFATPEKLMGWLTECGVTRHKPRDWRYQYTARSARKAAAIAQL